MMGLADSLWLYQFLGHEVRDRDLEEDDNAVGQLYLWRLQMIK